MRTWKESMSSPLTRGTMPAKELHTHVGMHWWFSPGAQHLEASRLDSSNLQAFEIWL